MIGLCDCNSFYASCEALFRPDLRGRGIVVLSNNDGCVVTANREAKERGIKRGDNWFEIKEQAERKGVIAFSSNYTLYASLSDRVMALLSEKTAEVMPYSIDEAFFTPGTAGPAEVRYEVSRESGIPVSVGLGRTMTLAKVANHVAKKRPDGAFTLEEWDEDEVLKETPVEEVWGIGWRSAQKLRRKGVYTAAAFRDLDDDRILKEFTVTGLRTALELRGKNAHTESVRNASFASGITFGKPIINRDDLLRTLICHCQTLSEKLEAKGLEAGRIAVSVFTSRFRSDFYSPFVSVRLRHPTNYLPIFAKAAEAALSSCWREGTYKGSRVFALDISRKGERQYDLFYDDGKEDEKRQKLSAVVAETNRKYGKCALTTLRNNSLTKAEMTKAELKSPAYTTRFSELPVIRD